MDTLFITVSIIVALALVFDFINGFHDTANAIATSVSTKALRPRQAVLLAAIMNFLGAITFTGVAKTITGDIVDPMTLSNGNLVVMAALLSAITWNLLTWYYGIPSSSSHTLIGSIAGAAIASAGFGVIEAKGFLKILQALLISPILAFGVGFTMYALFKVLFKKGNISSQNRRFRYVQVVTAAFQSFSHGTNDAQKAMGIITMALLASGYQTSTDIQPWVQISAATAIALGTSVGGWRIIKTVGGQIMKLRPSTGVAADLSSATVILSATLLHLPVSTTHVVASSILGVGTSHRRKQVKWRTAQRMLITWVITLPISMLLAGTIYFVLSLFV